MTKKRIVRNAFYNADRYILIFNGTELHKAFCQEENNPYYRVFNPSRLYTLECLYKNKNN